MKSNNNISLLQKLKNLSLFFSVIVAMVGFIVLVGWIGNIPILKSISLNWISMKVNTAICFLLSGVTLILLIHERPGRMRKLLTSALSLIIILIGTVSLLQYIFHFNAGIDEFFFKDNIVVNGTAFPGRPAPETAFCFILFGFSFLFGGITKTYPLIFQWLNIIAGFIALIGLLGYLFGVEQLSGISVYTSMAFHTSFTFLILMEASLLLHADKGIMKLPSSNTIGGRLIRNSFPAIVAAIIIIGWLHYQGELAGLYDTRLGITILIISIIIVFTLVLFFNASSLSTTEKKMKQSETQLRAIFANSSVGLILLDTNCTILELNDRTKYFNSLSFGRELMKGENLLLSIPGYRKEEFRKNFEKVLQGERINFESVYPQADGSIITFNVNLNPVIDEKGEIAGACLTFEDISERKKVEEKIKQLSQAVEQSPASVVITDLKGNIQYVNKKFSNVTGYAPEEVIGKNPRILKSGYTSEIDYRNLWKQITSGLEWRGEFHNKKKNGELYWESALLSPIINEKGEIISFLAIKEDITEHKRIEENLIYEQHLIQTIMNNLPEHIYFKDSQSRFLRINKSQSELFGLADPSQAIGKTDFDFFSKEHATNAYNDEQAIMLTGQPISKEEKEIWPDKSTTYVLTTKMPFRNQAGNIIGTFGISIDITERKKAENELQKAHDYNQLLLDSIAEGAYGVDNNGLCTFVNRAFLRLLGYNHPNELIGKQIHPIMHHSYPDGTQYPATECKMLNSRKTKEQINVGDEVFWRKDGVAIPVEYWSYPIIQDDKVLGAICTFIDISERKNAEIQLRKSEEKFRSVFEKSTIGKVLTTTDGKMLQANQALASMLGYSILELQELNFLEITHPDDIAISKEGVRSLLANEKSTYRMEKRYFHKSGSIVWTNVGITLLRDSNNIPIYFITSILDITDQIKAQADLISMEEKILDQKIQEQKNVARAIIKAQEKERNHMGQELHDNVNQILAGTKLYLGMIGQDDKTKEAIKYPMELIDNAINEIRLISHKNVTSQTNINLMDLLQSLINDLGKNTTIKPVLRFGLNGEIKDDELKLNIYRVIQEQVNNILKHAAAKNVSISLQAIDNSIQVITTDDGKGFDLNKIRKGIGLSNMMNRIETFNGKMEIISSPGNGCKTTIEIPY